MVGGSAGSGGELPPSCEARAPVAGGVDCDDAGGIDTDTAVAGVWLAVGIFISSCAGLHGEAVTAAAAASAAPGKDCSRLARSCGQIIVDGAGSAADLKLVRSSPADGGSPQTPPAEPASLTAENRHGRVRQQFGGGRCLVSDYLQKTNASGNRAWRQARFCDPYSAPLASLVVGLPQLGKVR